MAGCEMRCRRRLFSVRIDSIGEAGLCDLSHGFRAESGVQEYSAITSQ